MTIRYRTVSLRSKAGIRLAERLKASGWIISSVGFDTIYFYKPVRK